jgi:hypothetical protein
VVKAKEYIKYNCKNCGEIYLLYENNYCPMCHTEFNEIELIKKSKPDKEAKIINNYKEYKNYVVIYTVDKKNDKIIDTKVSKEDFYNKLINFKVNWFPLWNEDMKDYYIGYTLYVDKNGKKKPVTILLHRVLMNAKSGEYVDHKNHKIRDNRRNNLQLTSNKDNLTNRKGKNSNNKSGYRNVFWDSNQEQWCVTLCKNYKSIHIGYFDDVHEAGLVAEEARKKYYGKYAGVS